MFHTIEYNRLNGAMILHLVVCSDQAFLLTIFVRIKLVFISFTTTVIEFLTIFCFLVVVIHRNQRSARSCIQGLLTVLCNAQVGQNNNRLFQQFDSRAYSYDWWWFLKLPCFWPMTEIRKRMANITNEIVFMFISQFYLGSDSGRVWWHN